MTISHTAYDSGFCEILQKYTEISKNQLEISGYFCYLLIDD
jgi:hypothetical protein